MERIVDCCHVTALLIKSLIARSIFMCYGIVAVWRVTVTTKNPVYWLLLLTLAPVCIEMIYFVKTRRTSSFKWIAPNVFFFFACVIPSIWILEVTLLNERLLETEKLQNISTVKSISTVATTITVSVSDKSKFAFGLNNQQWALALEQILIFALVLAKWIAPKGKLSLDELSQLLLVYISTGVDIVELFASFEDRRIRHTPPLVYLILFAWSLSLTQFVFVLTATKVVPVPDDDFETILKVVNYFKFVNPSMLQSKAAGWMKVFSEMKKTQMKEQGKSKGFLGKLLLAKHSTSDETEDEDEDQDEEKSENRSEKEKTGHDDKSSRGLIQNEDKDTTPALPKDPETFSEFFNKASTMPSFSKKDKATLNKIFETMQGESTEKNGDNKSKTLRKPKPRDLINSDNSSIYYSASEGLPYPYYEKNKKKHDDRMDKAFQAMFKHMIAEHDTQAAMTNRTNHNQPSQSIQYHPYHQYQQPYMNYQQQQHQPPFSYNPFTQEFTTGGYPRKRNEDVESAETSTSKEDEQTKSEHILFKNFRRRIAKAFTCFCLYNEIWSMSLSLLFQDIPFFVVRSIIMFYYRILTRLIILFSLKNLLNVFLLLNRIRTIVKTERKSWLRLMAKAEERERENEDESDETQEK